jgi:hypothetical protein
MRKRFEIRFCNGNVQFIRSAFPLVTLQAIYRDAKVSALDENGDYL